MIYNQNIDIVGRKQKDDDKARVVINKILKEKSMSSLNKMERRDRNKILH